MVRARSRQARNLIGTKADGTSDLGNSLDGVRIESLSNIVGATGAGNVIVGNGNNGVLLIGDDARSNVIRSNNITANDQHGVLARKGPNDVLGNIIVGNFEAGVLVLSSASQVKIMGNQIFANGEVGIDLAGGLQFSSGVTVNDTDDPDTGSNGLQNFPVLTSAVKSNQTNITTVAGSLNSNGSTDFTIELFRVLADPSGYGEGLELIGSKQIRTSSGGDRNLPS
ncbi:MAG: right-handed parallel beta-helix repeat-containing protein [Candidatus Limnocylindrales bacterium]